MRESDAAGIAEAQTKMQLCQISISRKRIIPIPEFGLDQFVLGKELVPLSNFNSIVLLMPPTVPFSFHDNSNNKNESQHFTTILNRIKRPLQLMAVISTTTKVVKRFFVILYFLSI